MKLIRINYDGSMNDISINTKITPKNVVKLLNKNSVSLGEGDMKELYRWRVDNGNSDISCYGWCDGNAGFENKHDLPPSGMSDFIDDDDSSDTKILFGDIFITLSSKGVFKDIDVSNYANYYEGLFEGFDECNTSDDELSEDEGCDEDDNGFIDDEPVEDSDDSYTNIEELDIDENDYTDDDSDYNEECEGEDDSDSDETDIHKEVIDESE
jgi:hypothetical protein